MKLREDFYIDKFINLFIKNIFTNVRGKTKIKSIRQRLVMTRNTDRKGPCRRFDEMVMLTVQP